MPEPETNLVIKTNRSWSVSYRTADGRRLSSSGFSSRAEATAGLREILSQIDQTGRIEQKDPSSAT